MFTKVYCSDEFEQKCILDGLRGPFAERISQINVVKDTTKMSRIYETLHTTTVCALQMTQPKRSKTVSSLGISADSPPITCHSHKARVDH
jgi:hypothetical protein